MADFKYSKEDEDKVVTVAKRINAPLVAFTNAYIGDAHTLEFIMNTVRETTKEYLEDIAEEDEELEILASGKEIFRQYDEIKDLAAISVIAAEAALAADGYTFRILRPEEVSEAQLAIEEFPSYQELIKQKKEGQMRAYEHLQEIKTSQPELYEKHEKKNKVSGITQLPVAVFEIHPRKNNKQYLALVSHMRMPNTFHILSKDKSTILDELRFYDPNLGEDEIIFYDQFKH